MDDFHYTGNGLRVHKANFELRIYVPEIYPAYGHGNLRAVATVVIGPIEIRGFRIIQCPGEQPYVLSPAEDDCGYTPKIELGELLGVVQKVVLEAWGARNDG